MSATLRESWLLTQRAREPKLVTRKLLGLRSYVRVTTARDLHLTARRKQYIDLSLQNRYKVA